MVGWKCCELIWDKCLPQTRRPIISKRTLEVQDFTWGLLMLCRQYQLNLSEDVCTSNDRRKPVSIQGEEYLSKLTQSLSFVYQCLGNGKDSTQKRNLQEARNSSFGFQGAPAWEYVLTNDLSQTYVLFELLQFLPSFFLLLFFNFPHSIFAFFGRQRQLVAT